MRFDSNLIPVESDVNQFLSKDRLLLDNHIADILNDFNIS